MLFGAVASLRQFAVRFAQSLDRSTTYKEAHSTALLDLQLPFSILQSFYLSKNTIFQPIKITAINNNKTVFLAGSNDWEFWNLQFQAQAVASNM